MVRLVATIIRNSCPTTVFASTDIATSALQVRSKEKSRAAANAQMPVMSHFFLERDEPVLLLRTQFALGVQRLKRNRNLAPGFGGFPC